MPRYPAYRYENTFTRQPGDPGAEPEPTPPADFGSASPACLSFDFATMSLGPATLEVDFFTGLLSAGGADIGPAVPGVDFHSSVLSIDPPFTIV
jgi:hypothetical protein